MKKTILMSLVFVVLLIGIASADNMYSQNYSYKDSGKINAAYFVVQELKYEPYPVSPGESFDLWIKVQNIGQMDATDARFNLQLESPFSSSDNLDQDYGLVSGTANAYAHMKSGEVNPQENQIVLKYRITVDGNAIPGTNYIKMVTYTNSMDSGQVFSIPISVDKTKTDFNLALQKADATGYSFLISNVGDNSADSLSVTLNPESGLTVNGDRIFVVGKLNKGDFTKFSVPLSASKDVKEVTFKMDYTDTSGARRSVEKTVSLEGATANLPQTNASPSYVKWIYLFVGFIIGLIAMSIVKRKQIKNLLRK